jgi:hypothetical protein
LDYPKAVALGDLVDVAAGMDDIAIFRGADATRKRQ